MRSLSLQQGQRSDSKRAMATGREFEYCLGPGTRCLSQAKLYTVLPHASLSACVP